MGAVEASVGATGEPACEDGEEQRCLVHYELASGVPTCWEGVSVCAEGRWGPCGAPPEGPGKGTVVVETGATP